MTFQEYESSYKKHSVDEITMDAYSTEGISKYLVVVTIAYLHNTTNSGYYLIGEKWPLGSDFN